MHLPKSTQKTLAKEFRSAADQMAHASDMQSMLFFLSAFFGAVSRAFNETWADELALLHLVLQGAHATISTRLGQMKAGTETPVVIPTELPDALQKVAEDLAGVMAAETVDDLALFAVLVRFTKLTYATTGNGYYLYLKGDLKI